MLSFSDWIPKLEGRPEPVPIKCSYSLVEPVMEATSMSSWDGVLLAIGVNVFTGFAKVAGFLLIPSGGEGLIEEWCDVRGAMASCLSTCRGQQCACICGGQLADWSHWCGSPYCGSLLDQLLCRWFAGPMYWCWLVHCSSWFPGKTCDTVDSCRVPECCAPGASWFLCICGLM